MRLSGNLKPKKKGNIMQRHLKSVDLDENEKSATLHISKLYTCQSTWQR